MPKNKKTSSVPPFIANRYFAVEALKRSKKLKRYQPGNLGRTIPCRACDIPEGALEMDNHEQYLSASLQEADPLGNEDMCGKDLNMYDLKLLARTPPHEPMGEPRRNSLEAQIHHRYLRHDPDEIEEIDGEDMVLALVRNPTPEWLCLALPMREHPETLIKLLRPFLKRRHAEAMRIPRTISWKKRNKNYFEDISAWRRNIQCYDLAEGGASHKEIVSKIYPDAHSEKEHRKAIARVKSAIAQVKNMIASAENGIWPPNR